MGEDVANSAIMLSVLGLPAATGVAILRHRLYDIDVVINRTIVYAALTAGLAAIYAAVSLSLGVAVGAGSTLPTAAATLAVAVGFRPLRSRVQVQVDRRFNRARYEALRQVQHYLSELRAGRAAPDATGDVMAQALEDPSLRALLLVAGRRGPCGRIRSRARTAGHRRAGRDAGPARESRACAGRARSSAG